MARKIEVLGLSLPLGLKYTVIFMLVDLIYSQVEKFRISDIVDKVQLL